MIYSQLSIQIPYFTAMNNIIEGLLGGGEGGGGGGGVNPPTQPPPPLTPRSTTDNELYFSIICV